METQIKNFKLFLQRNNCSIPSDFITNYYLLTKNNFVSLIDCVYWLKISRDAIVKTIKRSYKKDIDYIEISKEEELEISILNKKYFEIQSNKRLYYKLTVDCFKKISMSSNSKVGKMVQNYYIAMEEIVKNYANQEMTRLENEVQKLKRNLKPVQFYESDCIYVWHYNDDLVYRIGSSKDLTRRIKEHNYSHPDNVTVDFKLKTNCYKDLEHLVLRILDDKRHRKDRDFFDCDIKIIRKTVKQINNLLTELRNKCKVDDNLKKISKKTSKQQSKKTSKQQSKKTK